MSSAPIATYAIHQKGKPKKSTVLSSKIMIPCGLVLLVVLQFSSSMHWFLDQVTRNSLEIEDRMVAPTVNIAAAVTKGRKKTFRLVHVMNIYATNKNNGTDRIHQPYDQWVTLKSIERAKQHMPRELDMTLVCAILQSDWDVLSEETVPVCDRRVLLKRSTLTEYGGQPNNFTAAEFGKNNVTNSNPTSEDTEAHFSGLISSLFSQQELPFMQDILDGAISVARENAEKIKTNKNAHTNGDDDLYIMLTNADIGVTEYFYRFLYRELQEGRKAFTINRMTLNSNEKKKPITVQKPTNNETEIKKLFEQIDAALPYGNDHPGTDCFIMHWSIIDNVFLGNQFPGYSPWAFSLLVVLRDILAKGSYAVIQSTVRGTFHLDDNRSWNHVSTSEASQKMYEFVHTKYKGEIADCPIKKMWENPHTALNIASCGISFREHYGEFLLESKGGICPYNPLGWIATDHLGCEAYRLGKGPYPWENNRTTE